ncbi:MAG: zinc ribbon domain-containing protein [Clostridia bacterium]|nr:zinc ribbon domain-containing protein [Clostridia bacterium]
MYCINCGVKLEDTEKKCPLCGTVPFHPEIVREEGERLYPENKYPRREVSPKLAHIIISTMYLIGLIIPLLCDLQINSRVTWSGYVVGALILSYVVMILPYWFKRPNPVIFVPCGFAAAGLYLWYINYAVNGDWFLSFAFPVVGAAGVVVTAVVTLVKYVRRGKLYIFGGASLLLGVLMPVLELLVNITFARPRFVFWSLYPLTALVLLGAMLIFLAICRPARESMERKFFI